MDDPAWHGLLAALANLSNPDRLSRFHVLSTTYKDLAPDNSIRADILLPKSAVKIEGRPLPVLVRIHGGYLVSRLDITNATYDLLR